MACAGNSSEACGGPNRLTVFSNPGGGPKTDPGSNGWGYIGCYTDSTAARTLTTGMAVNGGASSMTVNSCLTACKGSGFTYAGVEYANECYCGNAISNGGGPASDGSAGCSMTCAGNSSEFCGGSNRLNVYQLGASPSSGNSGSSPTSTANGSGSATTSVGGSSSPTASKTTSQGSSPTQKVAGVPSGWFYHGCWVDEKYGRILPTQLPDSNSLTVESCISSCQTAGYSISGMEYASQCFCGDEIIEGGALAQQDTDCNMACSGSSSEMCGGPSRMSIYSNSKNNVHAIAPPVTQNDTLPGKWQYVGCLR
jgi:hypothetical protein